MSWLLPDDVDGLLPVVNLTSTAIARGEEVEREVSDVHGGCSSLVCGFKISFSIN
jgi:hypothetical protein